ncbi:MAG: hypothetical protein EOM72_12090 [Opitutae bacterium]|nr:hypothetical protein [Opitutae bacterium]
MRLFAKIVVGIVAVLAIALVALELSLNSIVLKGFNSAAPGAIGVPASLQGADISLARGKATLAGLHIGNPAGYKTDGILDLASVSVTLDNASLLTDTILIKEIAIDGLVVTYEKGLLNSNLGALIESLSAGEDKPAEGEAKEEKTAEEKPAKKVVIEKLTITGARMHFSVTAAAALTGGGSLPIPLPPITLTDLGKEKDGVTVVEAIRRVLTAIAEAAGAALAGSAHLIGQGLGAVGDGVWAVGEGAVGAGTAIVGGTVDAGKAVVGGAVDAGKAIGGGALDAGKAIGEGVGDALNAVNPFKK